MATKYPPIAKRFPHFLHGGDYNPDQWLDRPDILKEDYRLMKAAHCNAMSVGIFAWSALEPEEGKYTFDWLDRVMDGLAEHGAYAVLATPSGAKPGWMAFQYPEIRRVNAEGRREDQARRHNHCPTSPVYRRKVSEMNTRLAERYAKHPALLVWHLSNEYSGECYCELCLAAFRQWLSAKYRTLAALNSAWWTAFWSHTYSDWNHILPVDHAVHGLMLDWKRFTTDQTVDFMKNEIAPLKKCAPETPVTTNLMGFYTGLNYWKFAPELDVVSWDSYPRFHDRGASDIRLAGQVAMTHDLYRSLKGGRPFMLMESSPSATNWMEVGKLKRPGVHRLMSLQAVAHGADTVQYFQWRAGRGGAEKFHGAVVAHDGTEHTRVFQEVAEVGAVLRKLDPVIGTSARPEVAVIYDWENRWAIDAAAGPRKEKKDYFETCVCHYRAFWRRAVPADVIDMDGDFSKYRLVVAPMLYLLRDGVAGRLEAFVRRGGVLVSTYWSGIVDGSDLCFLGGRPGPLRGLLGIRSEEIDALYDDESVPVVPAKGNALRLTGRFKGRELCDLIHAESAEVLAVYAGEFYKNRPALTVNRFGKGRAYYMAFRGEDGFIDNFYGRLVAELKLKRAVKAALPDGVSVQMRSDGTRTFYFLLNFSRNPRIVKLDAGRYRDLETDKPVKTPVKLAGYGSKVLEGL